MAPTRTIRVARAASRRRLTAALVTRLGRALLAAALVSLLLVGAFKLAGSEPPWTLLAAPVLAGVAWAVASALRGRWSVTEAACELDQRLGLRDRLGSGLGLAGAAERDAFAAIALREAERAADGVDVRAAVPLRVGNSWLAWPIVGAGVIAATMFVPVVVWPAAEAPAELGPVARRQSADELRKFADRAEQTLGDDPSPAAAEALDAIDRLENELLAGERMPEEARTIAAEQVGRAADELAQRAREEQTTADELRERLARASDSEDMSDLAERLRDGDLEGARDAVRDMMNARDSMDESQRQALRRDLEALADRVENPPAEPPSSEREPLEELGVDPESLDGADPADAERTAEALENEGVDPETARRVAEDVAQRDREERARERAQGDAERLSEALRSAAEDLETPSEPPPPASEPPEPPSADQRPPDDGDQPRDQTDPSVEPQQPPEAQPQERQPGDQQQPGEPREQPDQPQQPGEQTQPSDRQQPRPDDEGRPGKPQPTDRPGQAPGEQPRPAPPEQPQPGQQQPDPGGQPQPGERPQPDPDTPRDAGQDPDQQGSSRPDPAGPEDQLSDPAPQPGDPGGSQEPRAQPGAEPTGQQRPGAPPQPQPGEPGEEQRPVRAPDEQIEPDPNAEPGGRGPGEGLDGLEREIDRLARREGEARKAMERSEELRRQAEELLDGLRPEDREQLDQWARELERQQPRNPDDRPSVPADLRPETGDTPERVIAEWYGDGEAPDGAAAGGVNDRVRRAADSALRAVEDQAVPVRRRELVRRVFDRVREEQR